jgi:hypothetical protein
METPFTATIITYKEGQIRTRRQTIARASDGSTYVGFFDRDGRLLRADIDDVASDRHIPLFASGEFSHTYTLSTPSRGKSRRTSIDQVRESWRWFQSRENEQPDQQTPDRLERRTSLGEKISDGMTQFGFRLEVSYSDGTRKIEERWESDLGITMNNTYVRKVGIKMAYAVTNLHREEPDRASFKSRKILI